MLRWIKGVTLRRERNENVEVDQGCDRERERGMRMLRWIKGERERNENVENVEERNENVDQGCDTKGH